MTRSGDAWTGAPVTIDASACPKCLRETCDGTCAPVERDAAAPLPGAVPVEHADRVRHEMDRERARREAHRRLAVEEGGRPPIPDIVTLRERLARPRVTVTSRIEGFQPTGTRVMIVAPAKSGKTTLVGSLIRSLVDGDPFLGRAAVVPVDGTVALIDVEMPAWLLDAWLAAQRIHADDRVIPMSLRGSASAFDVLDPECRRAWATWMRARHVQYVILDCVRPILDVLGLDEQRDAGRFLVAFDALLADAGVPEAAVVHHTGHGDRERARGDSRLIDWPDATWRLVCPRTEDGTETGARYLAAYGRDVDHPESLLSYDPLTRRLTIVGGSRHVAAAQAAAEQHAADTDAAAVDVRIVLAAAPEPLSQRAVEGAVLARHEHRRAAIRDALRRDVQAGKVVVTEGPRGATLHRLAAKSASAPSAPTSAPAHSPDADSSAPVRRRPFRDGALAQSIGGGGTDQKEPGALAHSLGAGDQAPNPAAPAPDPWAPLGWPPGSAEAAARADARRADRAPRPRPAPAAQTGKREPE